MKTQASHSRQGLHLWRNARVVTCAADAAPGAPPDGASPGGASPDRATSTLPVIDDGFVLTRDGVIDAVGPMARLPPGLADALDASQSTDCDGLLLTPGLIDCHTHLVYGGDRAREFELRLEGASYEQIAAAGGGIVSTVAATRRASDDELFESAAARLRLMMQEGVTTVEIKSGYGLDLPNERKCLRVARRLSRELGVQVRTTFLGAHAVPPEYAGRPDDYIAFICTNMLPALAEEGLVDAVDAFCERIAFSPAQTRRVFETARGLGIPVKLHAEQLSDQGGAALAAEFGALSCDHLEYVSEAGVGAMARAGTVAVLLPGAYYFLRETRTPPVAALRAHRVPMAIATDCNPGSSPVTSPLLMLNMACTLFRLTPSEAFLGLTRHAARALGLQGTHGSIEPGRRADLALWHAHDVAELCYWIGAGPRSACRTASSSLRTTG